MGRRNRLGEFEQLLLLAVLRLGEDAYGVTLRREIQKRTGRSVTLGAIYPTMDRLEEKGFVDSSMSDPEPRRGGRSRRYYRLLPEGRQALDEARTVMEAMWEGIESPAEP